MTSIDAVIKPLESRFESLILKGKLFRFLPFPTTDDLHHFGQKSSILTRPLMLRNWASLVWKTILHYMNLSKGHCDASNYCLTFTKFTDSACGQCSPPILPPELFQSVVSKRVPLPVLSKDLLRNYCKFQDIYGTA